MSSDDQIAAEVAASLSQAEALGTKGEPQAPLFLFNKDAEGSRYIYYDRFSFNDRVALIGHHFSISPEEMYGGYFVKCLVNHMPCNNCRGIPDSIGCTYGRLSVKGLTGFAAYRLFDLAQSELLKSSIRLGALISGKYPWSEDTPVTKDGKPGTKSHSREQVEMLINDPIKGFPYDVKYPTEAKVREFAKVNKVAHAIGFASDSDLWSEDRIQACLQSADMVAKRCSVNGNLWRLYKTTPGLTLKGLERRLRASYWNARLKKATTDDEKLKCMNALAGV